MWACACVVCVLVTVCGVCDCMCVGVGASEVPCLDSSANFFHDLFVTGSSAP